MTLKGDRNVNGIRCSEVLAALSDYMENSLNKERVSQIVGHVEECRNCERFGADFASAMNALRSMSSAPVLDSAIAERLRLAIAEE